MIEPYTKILISNGAMTYKRHTIKNKNKIFKKYINTLLSQKMTRLSRKLNHFGKLDHELSTSRLKHNQ